MRGHRTEIAGQDGRDVEVLETVRSQQVIGNGADDRANRAVERTQRLGAVGDARAEQDALEEPAVEMAFGVEVDGAQFVGDGAK